MDGQGIIDAKIELRWVWLIILGLIGFGFFFLWDTNDIIIFSPTPTPDEKAVLIDGMKGGVFMNDLNPGVVSAAINQVVIGDFTANSSTNSGEVVAFSRGKAPFIKTTIPWSIFTDIIQVDFHDLYNITVEVWMLTESAYLKRQLIDHVDCKLLAESIWKSEGHGLQITCVIHDARNLNLRLTSNGGASGAATVLFNNRAFDCVNHEDDLDLQNSAAYQSGALNVYYVDKVTTVLGTSPHYGIHCNSSNTPNVIAIGTDTAGTLAGILAHEIGHALIGNGLEDHIDNLSPIPPCQSMPTPCTTSLPNTKGNTPSLFDRTNVMHGASSGRATLTEGQVFRAFFNKNSALNLATIYNLNLNASINNRICGGVGDGLFEPPTPTPECPQLEKRLWPDKDGEYGTWLAN